MTEKSTQDITQLEGDAELAVAQGLPEEPLGVGGLMAHVPSTATKELTLM